MIIIVVVDLKKSSDHMLSKEKCLDKEYKWKR